MTSVRNISRRRILSISAAAAGMALLPGLSRARATGSDPVVWRGHVLGAEASMELHHPDRNHAQALLRAALAEIERLEQIFSLYSTDSALARLNRDGALAAPPVEFVELLSASRRFHQITDGAFDPSVQPLWLLFQAHFARPDADPSGPSHDAIDNTRAHIGFDRVVIGDDRIVLPRGAALTLNGVAQGYITDRVVDLLRRGGMDHSMVNLGEARAIGPRPDAQPWRIGISDPAAPDDIKETLDVIDRAVSTSGAYGFTFDAAGNFHHLFDPRSGLCPALYRSVTVTSPTATAADALSTAIAMTDEAAARRILASFADTRAIMYGQNGERIAIG